MKILMAWLLFMILERVNKGNLKKTMIGKWLIMFDSLDRIFSANKK